MINVKDLKKELENLPDSATILIADESGASISYLSLESISPVHYFDKRSGPCFPVFNNKTEILEFTPNSKASKCIVLWTK